MSSVERVRLQVEREIPYGHAGNVAESTKGGVGGFPRSFLVNRIALVLLLFRENAKQTGDGRDVQHSAAFRVQVRTARPGGRQGQRTADDLLLGGQRASAESGASAGHGDPRGGGGRRHNGRGCCGQTSVVAPTQSKRVRDLGLTDSCRFIGAYAYIFAYLVKTFGFVCVCVCVWRDSNIRNVLKTRVSYVLLFQVNGVDGNNGVNDNRRHTCILQSAK